ncbi:A/G-specific adenine glycosylase [Sporosarcina sp. P37]|uniref:A/G-specific adenine glycosylase n=1 Tax=unclassified Sporosarcina TaxID=2647733 RepID=UPI0009C01FF5|nr:MULTISPECIES: A/G-specific adenine glycosylase [unclassified Sporosarcina]ARD47691.1 A/G-specific adenine glycosylase [Sporosarcina sp. P33]ARK24223.1 A/G-specific adenine glycosylase [Sporosarcina sp. P37]PID17105.1 A/G-specific adenine glycosylase [Sporosarcina sp. P35]
MQIIEQKKAFQDALLGWYEAEKRDLPWRRTDNPYYIWISEVMLQQTRVETVIPYYERFIERFPTMQDLSDAPEEDILKMWEGLGYYSRVRNLQSGVREVVETYGGQVPNNRKEISTLKGVGPYTAGAILSIAYGVPEHAVDGNVMRVLSRILLIEEDIALARNKKLFEQAVMELISEEDPSSFNQALMELGATICTPNPHCLLCPVRDFCIAFSEGKQQQLPIKIKKQKMKHVSLAAFAIQNEEGNWLMQKRPDTGLLAGLWEFPMTELQDAPAVETFEKEHHVKLKNSIELTRFSHVFSHITWDIHVYRAQLDSEPFEKDLQFFTKQQVEALPKSKPVLKIIEQMEW